MDMRSIAKFDAIENKSYIKYMVKSRVKTYNKIVNIYNKIKSLCQYFQKEHCFFLSLSISLLILTLNKFTEKTKVINLINKLFYSLC